MPLDPAVQSLLKDSSAFIPAIVQDTTTQQVLMLAYELRITGDNARDRHGNFLEP